MKRWFKWTGAAVALFIILFLWARSAESETLFEVAPAEFIGGEYVRGFGVMMTERFRDRYDIGVMLLAEVKEGRHEGNLGIHIQRIVHYHDWELGLGAAYFSNQTAWSQNVTFALSWGYDFGKWEVRHRHYSTGGTSDRNSGLDMLTIGYSFY